MLESKGTVSSSEIRNTSSGAIAHYITTNHTGLQTPAQLVSLGLGDARCAGGGGAGVLNMRELSENARWAATSVAAADGNHDVLR